MRSRIDTRIRLGLASVALLTLIPSIGRAQLGPGDLIVSTSDSLLAVNPLTGQALPIGTGTLVTDPRGVALLPDGNVVVLSGDDLVLVDPVTDEEVTLATVAGTHTLAVEADGSVLAGGLGGGLIRVDPGTGNSSPLVAGSATFRPSCLAVASDGEIFASDDGIDGFGGIHRIDPVTGTSSLIPTAPLDSGMCLTIDANDQLIVTLVTSNEIWVLDPSDGTSFVLTVSGAYITGPYLAAVSDGNRYYVDTFLTAQAAFGIVEIDPGTGAESLIWSGPVPPDSLRGLATVGGVPTVQNIPTLSELGSWVLVAFLVVAALSRRRLAWER